MLRANVKALRWRSLTLAFPPSCLRERNSKSSVELLLTWPQRLWPGRNTLDFVLISGPWECCSMPFFAVAFLSEAKMIEIFTGKLCEGSSTFRTLWGKVPRVSLSNCWTGDICQPPNCNILDSVGIWLDSDPFSVERVYHIYIYIHVFIRFLFIEIQFGSISSSSAPRPWRNIRDLRAKKQVLRLWCKRPWPRICYDAPQWMISWLMPGSQPIERKFMLVPWEEFLEIQFQRFFAFIHIVAR